MDAVADAVVGPRRSVGRVPATASCRAGRLLVAFGVFWGFAFGAIMDIYQLASFGPVFTWQAFVATHARGIPFDVTHAVTNAILLGVAGPGLIRLLRRHGRRLHVELVPDPSPP